MSIIRSGEYRVLESGTVVPFDCSYPTHFSFTIGETPISVAVYLEDDLSNPTRRYYKPEWEDGETLSLRITLYNTPLSEGLGGPTLPIKIGEIDDEKIYFRIRTVGITRANYSLMYTLYAGKEIS